MARPNVRTAGAVLGATAMALVGSPAADSVDPPLQLLPALPETVQQPALVPAGGMLGGPAMGKTVISPQIVSPGMSSSARTHTVAAGDTVWALAKTYNTTVAKIIEANKLPSSALIRIGQKLTIPGKASGGASTTTKPSSSTSKSTSSGSQGSTTAKTHKVAAGQTLSGIAAKYGTTAAKLASANKLSNPNFIRAGQTLKIPGGQATSTQNKPSPSKSSQPKPSATSASYTVRSGDTVWAIAQAHQTTTSAIISTNGLGADALIRVGQKLKIPSGSASASTSTPPSSTNTKAPTNSCKDLVPSTFLHYTYPDDVVRAANENKCTLDAMDVPGRDSMQSLVRQTALDMGVDPALAQAVAFQESGFNQQAVSPANAIGTMQVIPSSGEWAGQMLGRSINLLDPKDNVAAGVAILRSLQRSFPDNFDYAIGAYYQGAGSVSKYGLAADTKNYVSAIKAHMNRF